MDVVLVTIDCLRPDGIGLCGSEMELTLNLDRAMADAFRFRRCFPYGAETSTGLSRMGGSWP